MANTTKVNNTKKLNTKRTGLTQNVHIDNKYVKNERICQVFTRLTYANVIIGAVFYAITLITLFGAKIVPYHYFWLEFWVQNFSEGIVLAPTLSTFAIIVIVFNCLWLLLCAIQFICNLILHNKISLAYVPRVIIALCTSTILMLILGSCCKPVYATGQNEIYVSWMRLIKFDASTTLTSGAIIILMELILIYLGCVAYIIYYYISEAKKSKQTKQML